MAKGLFTITELVADGAHFEWTSDRSAPQGEGGARACPQGPWAQPGEQRTSRTDYPGGAGVSEQVLGPRHKEHTLKGQWLDRYNYAGYATETKQAFEEMARRGNKVRIQFQGEVFVGVITGWLSTYRQDSDIGYEFTMSVHRRENEATLAFSPPTLASPSQKFSEADLATQAVLQAQATKPTAAVAGTLSEELSDLASELNDNRNALGDTLDFVDTSSVTRPINDLRRIATQFRTLASSATSVIEKLVAVRSDVELTVRTAMSVLDFENWSRSLRFRSRLLLSSSQRSALDIEERADPAAVAFYRPQEGESLYAISRRFYGTPHQWRLIADRNGLRNLTLSGDELLIIPERGAGVTALDRFAATPESRIYYPQARAVLGVVFEGFGDTARDSDPYIIPVTPKSITIHRNSYNQADSWEMEFDGNSLPLDPRQIRAGSVEIYLFETDTLNPAKRNATADADAYASLPLLGPVSQEIGLAGAERYAFTLGNRPIIAGMFDDHGLEMSDSGKWVTLSGQDYTAFLTARHWQRTPGKARRIPTGKRLDLLLRDLLTEADPSGRLALVTTGVDAAGLPTVGGAEVNTNARGIPVEQDTSFWDVMYRVASRYGCILYVRGLDVVLTRPKNIEDLGQHDIKYLAWGVNIDSLRMNRHLGKEKVPRIVVQGYDPKSRALTRVEYPDKAQESPVGTPKGTKKTVEDEYKLIPVFGISDRQVLKAIAQNLFQIMGKAEREMVITTKDMRDMRQGTLMDLAAGDAVEVEIYDFSEVNGTTLKSMTPEWRYQALIDLGYADEVARAIAEHYDVLVGEQRAMRVKEVTYDWSADDGVRIELELQDFIVIDGKRAVANKEPRSAQRLTSIVDAKGAPLRDPLVEGSP